MSPAPAAVIVLSAGDGTRMKSDLNKALHRIGGRTLVGHALTAAAGTGAAHVAVVVRAQKEQVAAAAREAVARVLVAEQDDVYGTGRAAECGLAALPADLTGTVLVTTGDTPLLQADTLRRLTEHHERTGAAVTIITGIRADAHGYGRIVRDPDTGAVTFATSDLFLERLGLSSLADLPDIAPLLPDVDVIDDLSESLESEPRFMRLGGAHAPEAPLSIDVDQ